MTSQASTSFAFSPPDARWQRTPVLLAMGSRIVAAASSNWHEAEVLQYGKMKNSSTSRWKATAHCTLDVRLLSTLLLKSAAVVSKVACRQFGLLHAPYHS